MSSMADLLASLDGKTLTVHRGDQVTGTVVGVTDDEVYLDLGTKAEGVLNKKELSNEEAQNVKIGDKLSAFVISAESESGQVILASQPQQSRDTRSGGFRGHAPRNWSKFIQAMQNKKRLEGRVTELNRGGVVVEVDGTRGFLPTSQLSFENVSKLTDLVGQTLSVVVLEVDENNNRLIFSDRREVPQETIAKLTKFEVGQKVKGSVVAVVSFGVFLTIDGVEGFVLIQEAAWEKVEDLNKLFKIGQEVEAVIVAIDQTLGRLNLSIKQLASDPFTAIAEKFQPDDVVKGTVKELTSDGAVVSLKDGVEGLLPNAKMESTYQVGQEVSLLVDTVDSRQRKIYLAPMLTSTAGLIYK